MHINPYGGPSLVVQWLRIYLPTHRTPVQSLGRKDPTCHRAAKPACPNYRSRGSQNPMLCPNRSHHSEKLAPHPVSSLCWLQLEQHHTQSWRPPKK